MLTRIRIEPQDIHGATEGPANCPLPLSRAAARWVKRWDDHDEGEPRAFLIDVPEEVLHAHHN